MEQRETRVEKGEEPPQKLEVKRWLLICIGSIVVIAIAIFSARVFGRVKEVVRNGSEDAGQSADDKKDARGSESERKTRGRLNSDREEGSGGREKASGRQEKDAENSKKEERRDERGDNSEKQNDKGGSRQSEGRGKERAKEGASRDEKDDGGKEKGDRRSEDGRGDDKDKKGQGKQKERDKEKEQRDAQAAEAEARRLEGLERAKRSAAMSRAISEAREAEHKKLEERGLDEPPKEPELPLGEREPLLGSE